MKKLLIWFAVLFSAVSAAYGMEPGETGAAFLKIASGAKPAALGEAYTALASDAEAIYWNPAGLAAVSSAELSLTHLEYFEDVRRESIAYAQPMKDFGTNIPGVLGFSADGNYTGIPNKVLGPPGQDSGWQMRDGYYVASGPTYAAVDLALGAAYAYPLRLIAGHPIDVGAAARLLNQTIDTYSGWGGSLDLGAMYLMNDTDWYENLGIAPEWKLLIPARVGTAVQHIGSIGAMRPDGEGSWLPTTFRLGAGYYISFIGLGFDMLTVGLDLQQPIDNDLRLNTGMEYQYKALTLPSLKAGAVEMDFSLLTLSARAGYKLGGRIQSDLDTLAGLSFGLGAGVTAEDTRIELDYALIPYGVLSQDSFLSSTHRVSLTLKFGQDTGKIKKMN